MRRRKLGLDDAATTPLPDAGVELDAGKALGLDGQLKRVKTQLAQHELDRRRGAFIERAAVLEMLVARATGFRKALRTAGRRLASRIVGMVDPVEIQTAIDEEHDRILWDAYGKLPGELRTDDKKKSRRGKRNQMAADDASRIRTDR